MDTVRLVTVVREIWDSAYCETGDGGEEIWGSAYCETGDGGEGDMGQCIL